MYFYWELLKYTCPEMTGLWPKCFIIASQATPMLTVIWFMVEMDCSPKTASGWDRPLRRQRHLSNMF